MNGGPEFRNALIESGFPAARVEGVFRRLAEANILPALGRGRRPKDASPWLADHYAVAILGFAPINPIDAPSAVGWLSQIKHTGATLHEVVKGEDGKRVAVRETPSRVQDTTLLDSLAAEIEVYSRMTSAERAECDRWAEGRFIHLNVNELTASTVYQPEAESWGTDYFGPSKRNALMPPAPRYSWGVEVKIPHGVILLAAELLAEARAKQEALSSVTGPASAGQEADDAGLQNENAPDLPGSEASEPPPKQATSFTNQLRTTATGHSNTSESREKGKNYQSPSPARGWVSLQSMQGPPPCPLLMV
jgi:hypothetical protein